VKNSAECVQVAFSEDVKGKRIDATVDKDATAKEDEMAAHVIKDADVNKTKDVATKNDPRTNIDKVGGKYVKLNAKDNKSGTDANKINGDYVKLSVKGNKTGTTVDQELKDPQDDDSVNNKKHRKSITFMAFLNKKKGN
jgi:hypothetical protein